MRASPARPSGLKLTLAAGWYELPWWMPQAEVRRLLELLRAGLDDAAYAVELDWAGLEATFGRVSLAHSVVLLRVPSEVEPAQIASAQAGLGSVRVGLVLHERVGEWANAAWMQRQVKVPLLAALERELHQGQHPFAGLELGVLPLDELAALTDEPVELLELFDAVVAHRLRYAAQGLSLGDWQRSLDLAVGERLAARLLAIPVAELAAALELVIDAAEQPLWPSIDRREGGQALARVGLAWQEGSDVLVGALARQAGRPTVLRRLLARLPAEGWSAPSRMALRAVIPSALPLPRATDVTPEPSYSDFPPVRAEKLLRILYRVPFEHHAVFDLVDQLANWLEGDQQRLLPWSEDEPSGLAALVSNTLRDLDDDALIDLDLQRGRIRRFDAIDRSLTEFPNAVALIRWMGVSSLSRRIFTHRHVGVLFEETERALALVDDSRPLEVALTTMLGDLSAVQQHYDQAMVYWQRAEESGSEEVWLALRQMLVMLRLGSFAQGWEDARETWNDVGVDLTDPRRPHAVEVAAMIDALTRANPASDVREGKDSLLLPRDIWIEGEIGPDPQLLLTCRAAIALEREDWPRTLELLGRIDHSSDDPAAARARLIWAWTRVALGDLDLAAVTFDALHQLASGRGDHVLMRLAAEGRAWIASQSS